MCEVNINSAQTLYNRHQTSTVGLDCIGDSSNGIDYRHMHDYMHADDLKNILYQKVINKPDGG